MAQVSESAQNSLPRVIENKDHWIVQGPHDSLIVIPRDGRWEFNGDLVNPTFSPSVKHSSTRGVNHTPYCNHVIITDGKVYYCADCTHEYADQTHELIVIPEETAKWYRDAPEGAADQSQA